MGEKSRELAGLVQSGAQKTGDLLDQGLRSQEGIVLLGKLLDLNSKRNKVISYLNDYVGWSSQCIYLSQIISKF